MVYHNVFLAGTPNAIVTMMSQPRRFSRVQRPYQPLAHAVLLVSSVHV